MSRLACIAGMVFVVTLAVMAIRLVIADWHFSLAENEVATWGLRGYEPTHQDRELARSEIDTARRLAPWHADYLRLESVMFEWRANTGSDSGDPDVNESRVSDVLWALLERRPTSVYTWNRLLNWKESKGEYDTIWALAVRRVTELNAKHQTQPHFDASE